MFTIATQDLRNKQHKNVHFKNLCIKYNFIRKLFHSVEAEQNNKEESLVN